MKQTGIEFSRRRFFAIAGASAGAELLTQPTLLAKSAFGSVKQLEAGVLNIGYVEEGPSNGPAVILLHGWPYDIYSYADVMPSLVSQGTGC